jgi:hypothetical protein
MYDRKEERRSSLRDWEEGRGKSNITKDERSGSWGTRTMDELKIDGRRKRKETARHTAKKPGISIYGSIFLPFF